MDFSLWMKSFIQPQFITHCPLSGFLSRITLNHYRWAVKGWDSYQTLVLVFMIYFIKLYTVHLTRESYIVLQDAKQRLRIQYLRRKRTSEFAKEVYMDEIGENRISEWKENRRVIRFAHSPLLCNVLFYKMTWRVTQTFVLQCVAELYISSYNSMERIYLVRYSENIN